MSKRTNKQALTELKRILSISWKAILHTGHRNNNLGLKLVVKCEELISLRIIFIHLEQLTISLASMNSTTYFIPPSITLNHFPCFHGYHHTIMEKPLTMQQVQVTKPIEEGFQVFFTTNKNFPVSCHKGANQLFSGCFKDYKTNTKEEIPFHLYNYNRKVNKCLDFNQLMVSRMSLT